MSDTPVIEVEDLAKRFGDVRALRGVSFTVAEGTILGMLGPNGAGKTTAVRILSTLLPPDAGRARVAGYDVVTEADGVRSAIGLAGQYAAIDENLTGRENLELVGRLYHLPARVARRRSEEILERFSLAFAAHRLAKTYSGGMRRRLDLAASLVGTPQVLFLDEPTAGLDPRSRLALWEIIEGLVKDGTTLLLTTQYLEEADRLADLIVVIDHGRVIDAGTSSELKSRVGGTVLALTVEDPGRVREATDALAFCRIGEADVDADAGHIVTGLQGGGEALAKVVRVLDEKGIYIADLELRRPTLNDVFLTLTGHEAEHEDTPPRTRRRRRSPA